MARVKDASLQAGSVGWSIRQLVRRSAAEHKNKPNWHDKTIRAMDTMSVSALDIEKPGFSKPGFSAKEKKTVI